MYYQVTDTLLQENKCQLLDQGRSYQICSDIPSCVCIQPLVDFLRGGRCCSFGFPEWYQPSPRYAHILSLFHSFRPSFDQDHSWVSKPLSFRLAIRLSSTAPSFNNGSHSSLWKCKVLIILGVVLELSVWNSENKPNLEVKRVTLP